MILSPNKIMGSLVYRTREALNKNETFKANLKKYAYHDNCLNCGNFLLWHYPGTHNEISQVLISIRGEHASKVKFPAFLNYQSIRQKKEGGKSTIHYSIAIVGLVDSEWLTETREVQVFDLLLRPIYEEFIKQVQSCGYFNNVRNIPAHDYYEIFTTGKAGNPVNDQYGDYLDAVRIMDLTLELRTSLCDKDMAIIEEENNKVTENVNNILNQKQWQDNL